VEDLEDLPLDDPKRTMAPPFGAWAGLVEDKKVMEDKLRRATLSANQRMLRNAFYGFVEGCSESKRQGGVGRRACKKMQTWRLNKAFQSWICFM
jgi:hypothetical protein